MAEDPWVKRLQAKKSEIISSMQPSRHAITSMLTAAIDEAITEAKLTQVPHSVVEVPGQFIAVPFDCAVAPLTTVQPDSSDTAKVIADRWFRSNRSNMNPNPL
ncbi:hypothetical protein [Fodinicurvata sp. EGI_FJ10296]|uniref:hypothetical protein n=1 Tax=Fodinicurvata sp. EGI_FJ10296 TaxID=3231908 RepID=UPI003454B94A